jgi:hypothetical protein
VWIESKLRELAEKVMENPNLLNAEYSWLTSEKARRGFQFGHMLGTLDKDFTLMDKLIEQQITADQSLSLNFLGGYFRILCEKDTELWESKLDSLSEIKSFMKNIPFLTCLSGMTDKASKRILEMLQKGEIEIDSLTIFKFGGILRKMSEQAFINWASFILKEPSGQGITLLLDFIHSYYLFKPSKPLPKDVTLEVLLHPELWDESKGAMRDTMKDYYWKEIVMALIKTYPETSDIIARHILNSLGAEKSIFHGFPSEVTSKVLLDIVKNNPKEIWKELIPFLNSRKSKNTFYIMQWLRGELGFETSTSALNLFDIEDIWEWIDQKPEERATFLAHCVPPILFCSSEKICLARELLARYGNYKEVREGLSSNYSTECYIGPESLHYAGKKKALLEFIINEKDQNVLKWIDEKLEFLDRYIERAKIHEEKYGY